MILDFVLQLSYYVFSACVTCILLESMDNFAQVWVAQAGQLYHLQAPPPQLSLLLQ
jgi:hypothetical protein